MGFTGEEALKWKLDYIRAFNAMEKELKRILKERQQWEIERQKGVLVRHILTDTIKMKVADSHIRNSCIRTILSLSTRPSLERA